VKALGGALHGDHDVHAVVAWLRLGLLGTLRDLVDERERLFELGDRAARRPWSLWTTARRCRRETATRVTLPRLDRPPPLPARLHDLAKGLAMTASGDWLPARTDAFLGRTRIASNMGIICNSTNLCRRGEPDV